MKIIGRSEAIVLGLKRYFTGKPCKHGHTTTRQTKTGGCHECLRIKAASIYVRDRKKIRERKNKVYAENLDKARNDGRRKYTRRSEKAKQRARWRRITNPTKAKEIINRYRANNRIKTRTWAHTRRAREKASIGTFTEIDIERIRKLQGNRCAELTCRNLLNRCKMHIDHIVPLFRGGSNLPNNLQLLCSRCNCIKGARDPIDHARQMGRLL